MGKMLVKSQNGNDIWFVDGISIGERQPNRLIGDRLAKLLKKKKITEEELVKELGNSYRDNISRILLDKEIPNPKLLDKLIKHFELDADYFNDKELRNVIITDSRMIVAEYPTEKRAKEVLGKMDEYITEAFFKSKPIVIEFPKE